MRLIKWWRRGESNPRPQVIGIEAGYMLSRCFVDDGRASNDKLSHAPPPACLNPERWRKPFGIETAKVTPGSRCAVANGSDALSIKQRERSRCQLQVARFYEVLVRPGMLLKRQHPRRSHYAPVRNQSQKANQCTTSESVPPGPYPVPGTFYRSLASDFALREGAVRCRLL